MREITNELAPEPFRWTAEGLLAMQEVSICLLLPLPLLLVPLRMLRGKMPEADDSQADWCMFTGH